MVQSISGTPSNQSLWSAKASKIENAFIKKKMTECTAIDPQLYRSMATHVSVKKTEGTAGMVPKGLEGLAGQSNQSYVYDISAFVVTSELDTDATEVTSYRSGDAQVFQLGMSRGRTFKITLSPPPEGPLDSSTFKNVVGKAFMLLEKRNEIIDELKPRESTWVDGDARMDLKYDPATKSFDKKDFLTTLKDDIIRAMTPPDATEEEMEKIREKIDQAIMEMEDYFYDLMEKPI